MGNLGTVPNNGAPNYSTGLWPMPEPATDSSADGSIKLAGIIRQAATGMGASDGTRMSDSVPPTGGNDGATPDTMISR